MNPVLETLNLNIRFGGVVAAEDINVAIGQGEVVGLIGSNGAGKTTFVNMVTGYLKPDSGGIFFRGEEITRLAPRQVTGMGIRRSFQVPQLFPEMTVLDNMLTAISLDPKAPRSFFKPLRDAGRTESALATLEHFNIGSVARQEVRSQPQGVRKILDIAMAMVGETELVLLDEPTSGVSADEKFPLMDNVMAALKARNVSVMFVEHDMELVERYADRVVAFYSGKVISDAPTKEAMSDADVRRYVIGKELHRVGDEGAR